MDAGKPRARRSLAVEHAAAQFRAALRDLLCDPVNLEIDRLEGGVRLVNRANGARLEVADALEVYDARGALRLKVGDLT